mgnify:CR=1 FL=1
MGKDVLAGVEGVLGQCTAVTEAPPARTPHQVYKPYITEPFWGNHANRVLAYLTMMGDQLDRGFSIPAQWSPRGRLDVNVIEAAPVLNANRWSVKRWELEQLHRFFLRLSRSTSRFVLQSIEAFPLFPNVKVWLRYGERLLISRMESVWKLLKPFVEPIWQEAKDLYYRWLCFYRKHIRTSRILGIPSLVPAALSPANLRYTMPYEWDGLWSSSMSLISVLWVGVHLPLLIPPLAGMVWSEIPLALGVIIFFVGWAVALFYAIIAGVIWAVAAYVLVGSASAAIFALNGVIAEIISGVITPIFGEAAVTAILIYLAALEYVLWYVASAVIGSVAGLVTFWIIFPWWLAAAAFWLTVGVIVLGVSCVLFVAIFGSLIMVPALFLLSLAPLFITHFVLCGVRRIEVERYGTFANPYYSDARKVV